MRRLHLHLRGGRSLAFDVDDAAATHTADVVRATWDPETRAQVAGHELTFTEHDDGGFCAVRLDDVVAVELEPLAPPETGDTGQEG